MVCSYGNLLCATGRGIWTKEKDFTMKSVLVALACLSLVQNIWTRAILPERDADFASVSTGRLSHAYVDYSNEPPDKYFHESSFHEHYDGRFADRPLKYDEKQTHLTALIQTYLLTMTSLDVETWLMHGTLLGWYWNRKVMPWDSDLDVMIDERSLKFLAKWHNMTEHAFRLPRDGGVRKYLLEVNPHWKEGGESKNNRIDARWIDMEIGLFIDITTLRRDGMEEEMMMVKDGHSYLYDDVFPLRRSVFEGVDVRVPFAYGEILGEEYGSEALADVRHGSHRFDEEINRWLPYRVAIKGTEEEVDG